jgi:outer membrane murein-binding lipoprotein Lpp
LGENVKTRLLVAVAAAGVLALTGWSESMDVKDVCKQYQDLSASFTVPGASVTMDRNKVTGQFTELAANAPDSLRSDMMLVAGYIQAAVGDNDETEAMRLLDQYQLADRRVRDVCSKPS